ncbi:aspartic proteinase CDR1-like [Nicotiana tabacum]|uniref:Aspartic proteinase CDR1-like n=1 Tax=Nicotiana tabacum TaxID=4097 RepID=A0A1S4BDA6_TOBAC|nr:PREDICTED: aspartic proteinase CDR1-like [Nicotiana tabacum]
MSGVIEIGASYASLVSQLSPTFGQKISYYFMPREQLDIPSKLTFGDNPVIVKPTFVYYFLTLLGIPVSEQKLDLVVNSSRVFQEENIVIDSGTTYTFFPTLFYNQFNTLVREAIKVEPWVDNSSSRLSLCYKDLKGTDIPPMTLHFIGADVLLSGENIMPPILNSSKLQCLAFKRMVDQSFFGNMAQSNFLVGYNFDKNDSIFQGHRLQQVDQI